jgi:hypothetical protein
MAHAFVEEGAEPIVEEFGKMKITCTNQSHIIETDIIYGHKRDHLPTNGLPINTRESNLPAKNHQSNLPVINKYSNIRGRQRFFIG